MKVHTAKPHTPAFNSPWALQLLLLLSAILLLCDTAHAAPKPIITRVVTTTITTTSTRPALNDNQPQPYTFHRAQVVIVQKQVGKRVLVAISNGFVEAWLPQTALAGPGAFKPLESWHGVATLDLYQGDAGLLYHFHRDGSFSALSSGSDDGPLRSKGQLYIMGDIVWARTSRGRAMFGDWSVFRLKRKGGLCVVDLHGAC